MPKRHITIDTVRECHQAILQLVELGLAYVFPGRSPLVPNVRLAILCTAEERATAIPLEDLRRIFRDRERAFVLRDN